MERLPVLKGQIKFALVGCGRIGQNHINAMVENHDSCRLAAVCDVDQIAQENAVSLYKKRLEELGKDSDTPRCFCSYSELLTYYNTQEEDIDVVVLTTPSGLHSAQAVDAARAGYHVCSEKPMATKYSDGVEMVRTCAANGKHLFVVKQNRFNTTLQLVKKQIKEGRFGRIAIVAANVFWQRPQEYYDQAEWRGTWSMDGGAMMNQASHYVDLLEWLIGPIQSISAMNATIARNIEVEDTAVMNVRWRNGALGSMAVTMLAYPQNIEGSITILGEKGSVKIGGKAVNEIELWKFADASEDDNRIEDASYQTTSVYGFGHIPYYKNMIETLLGKEKPICNGEDGLKSLEVLCGAYISARDGKEVSLPLEY